MQYGKDISISNPILMTEKLAEKYKNFTCSNDIADSFLKNQSYLSSEESLTFLQIDDIKKEIVCFYSLNCSAIVINDESNIAIRPAVEIKYFAVNKKYHGLPYSKQRPELTLSHVLFQRLIKRIYNLSEKTIGASCIVLYSVERAVNFYLKNKFEYFDESQIPDSHNINNGAIAMYYDMFV